MTITYDEELDAPVYGAAAIREIARLKDLRQTYHFLEKGYLDAGKVGGTWVSTKRRILAVGQAPRP